jgi:hypothetical protein
MEEALRAMLGAVPAISARVAARIDWGLAPQGQALPCITLTVVTDGPVDHSLDGPGLSRARVQVDCWGETYREAKVLSRAVRTALDAWQGGVITGAFLAGAGARDLPDDDGVTEIHRVTMDFIINYHFG